MVSTESEQGMGRRHLFPVIHIGIALTVVALVAVMAFRLGGGMSSQKERTPQRIGPAEVTLDQFIRHLEYMHDRDDRKTAELEAFVAEVRSLARSGALKEGAILRADVDVAGWIPGGPFYRITVLVYGGDEGEGVLKLAIRDSSLAEPRVVEFPPMRTQAIIRDKGVKIMGYRVIVDKDFNPIDEGAEPKSGKVADDGQVRTWYDELVSRGLRAERVGEGQAKPVPVAVTKWP